MELRTPVNKTGVLVNIARGNVSFKVENKSGG